MLRKCFEKVGDFVETVRYCTLFKKKDVNESEKYKFYGSPHIHQRTMIV